MNDLVFIRVKSRQDLERFYPVMRELRKELTYEDFLNIYDVAHATDGYEIVAVENHGQVLAVMGYRILHDFAHGKHLYIDDLVSTENHRSKGLGAKLLNHAEQLAKNLGCKELRLCTGVKNELGQKFYERNGWVLRSVAYKKKF